MNEIGKAIANFEIAIKEQSAKDNAQGVFMREIERLEIVEHELRTENERLRKALEDIKSEIILEGEGVESTLYLMTDAALRGEK